MTAHRGGGSQAADRAWGKAQPRDALWDAAYAGNLAACTRLLGAGTHPVGYQVSGLEWVPPAATAPLSSLLVFQWDWVREWCQHADCVGPCPQDLRHNQTALHHAADMDKLEVARLLLESGADVNAKVTVTTGCRLLQSPSRIGRRSNGTG